jgi:hypothetical protein
MAERVYRARLERSFAAPRLTVWGLLSDTNRWDRASGLTPGKYAWTERDGLRVRTGTAKELGFDLEWIEPPYEWVEGRFVHGERRFSKGPVGRGGFVARLYDGDGGTTRVDATAYVAGSGALMPFVGPFMKTRFVGALSRYFDDLGGMLERPVAAAAPEPEMESPSLRARDLIARQPYDPLTQGPRSPTALAELHRRATHLDESLHTPLVERVRAMLAERPDEELAQMRPFELADRWGVDRRELLRVFLHATRAGLVDLRWQINCPVCRVAAQVVGALADVTGSVHCSACNIDYGIDFAKHVEAVFQCHPAIREVETAVYCASSPAFLPHVVAQFAIEPDVPRTEATDLTSGQVHVRLLSSRASADATLTPDTSLHVTVSRDVVSLATAPAEAGTPATIEVRSDRAVVVMLERTGMNANAVLGSVIATFPEFLDLFATEAPAAGVELSVAHLALLFSDLTGSTALYGRVGDARAFAIVQEHFRDMTAAIADHRGAVVKTMGDAVMASFVSEQDAIAAAISMARKCRERHGEIGLSAKLGVAAGPCLAVRANDRLDFFGTTVNLAARLQARASGGQLVLSRELAGHPEIAALLAPFPASPFRASLKGIATEQDLIAVDVS